MVSEKILRGLLDPAVQDNTILYYAVICYQSKRAIIAEDLESSQQRTVKIFVKIFVTVYFKQYYISVCSRRRHCIS